MSVWIFTDDVPLYIPEYIDTVLGEHGDIVDRVILAPPSRGSLIRRQYRMFGPVDGLRMGYRYARGMALDSLPPSRQRRFTGRLHSVSTAAEAHDIPVERVPDVSATDFVDRVRQADPELVLSIVCGQLIDGDILDTADWAINIHPSLLPDYRGPAPAFWPLYYGDDETGATAHVMTESFDAGPIIEQRSIPIRAGETMHTLYQRLADAGTDLAVDLLEEFPSASFETRPNPTSERDYYGVPTARNRREFKRRGNEFL